MNCIITMIVLANSLTIVDGVNTFTINKPTEVIRYDCEDETVFKTKEGVEVTLKRDINKPFNYSAKEVK